MPYSTLRLFLVALALLLVPASVPAQFSGQYADGVRFQDAQVIGGPEGQGPLRLKGSTPPGREIGPLFDAKNPVNWFADERTEAPPASRACVELIGGDRLPGQVIGYRYGTELPLEHQYPHLLVKIDPDAVQSPQSVVRVRAQAVRKVVWQPRRSDRWTPATLYLLDDRSVRFRAVRWTAEGVTLLLPEGGTRNVAFSEIAELHLPRRDPWLVYQETLAVLNPEASTRMARFETDRGLVITSTPARMLFTPTAHMLQPAWCLEPIGFPPKHLRAGRFFWPNEVPLSMIEPNRVEQRSPLEGARAWQTDQNVKLQALRSGGKRFGAGFGTQAYCELEFELPPMVSGFRTSVGLDEQAGRNGVGRAHLHLNSAAEKPLWESKPLVGSGEVVTTELFPLQGPGQGQKSLILIADVPAERPPEADPLNIRSFVDWLEPTLELDREKLRTAVQRLVPDTVAAWQGWTAAGPYVVTHRVDSRDPAQPRFRADAVVKGGSLVLSRKVEIGPNQNFLCLALSQEPGPSAGWVEVRIDGKAAGQMNVPPWEQGASVRFLYPTPSFVPLKKYRGKTVTIEVEHHPTPENGAVEWRSLDLVTSPDLAAWVPVEVVEAKALSPLTNLVPEPENTVFAQTKDPRKAPQTDTYTVVAETSLTDITAFRLELLPDPRLVNNGPGRGDGQVFLSEFQVKASPRDKPDQAEIVKLTAAGTDYYDVNAPANAVDGKPETGWLAVSYGRAHVIVFTAAQNVAFPGGARLTFTIEQHLDNRKGNGGRSPGRFRLLATNAPRPISVARPGIVLEPPGRKTVFEDEFDFVNVLNSGQGTIGLETKDKYSGAASVKVTGTRREHSRFLGEIRIRKEPGRGEFRYIQFAWKKSGGTAIGIELARSFGYGIERAMGPSYRYHSGSGKPWNTDSLMIDEKLPEDWVLVTRDLFTDFGEFTLTGLSLNPVDGSHALFDHIRLGRTLQDFED